MILTIWVRLHCPLLFQGRILPCYTLSTECSLFVQKQHQSNKENKFQPGKNSVSVLFSEIFISTIWKGVILYCSQAYAYGSVTYKSQSMHRAVKPLLRLKCILFRKLYCDSEMSKKIAVGINNFCNLTIGTIGAVVIHAI